MTQNTQSTTRFKIQAIQINTSACQSQHARSKASDRIKSRSKQKNLMEERRKNQIKESKEEEREYLWEGRDSSSSSRCREPKDRQREGREGLLQCNSSAMSAAREAEDSRGSAAQDFPTRSGCRSSSPSQTAAGTPPFPPLRVESLRLSIKGGGKLESSVFVENETSWKSL